MYAKIHAFANGKGLMELLISVGENHASPIPPEKASEFKLERLQEHKESMGVKYAKL